MPSKSFWEAGKPWLECYRNDPNGHFTHLATNRDNRSLINYLMRGSRVQVRFFVHFQGQGSRDQKRHGKFNWKLYYKFME